MDGFDLTRRSTDELERVVTGIEHAVGRARTVQMAVLREMDRRQVPLGDGCRSLVEWVTGRLDVLPDTAKTLVSTASRLEDLPEVEAAGFAGELSFDRTAAVARLAGYGANHEALAESAGLDVAGIHRLAASRRRLTRHQEHDGFSHRYVATQSNLDHTALDFHGHLVGIAGRVFEDALHQVGDMLPTAPGAAISRATRNADALWKMAQDALDHDPAAGDAAGYGVTVFVDATQSAATGAEAGVNVEAGPRVGPATLEAIICSGSVEVIATSATGTPLNLGRASRVISPRLRRFVIHRDGGVCTADGCVSGYRLEAHHIIPWSQGGRTDASNLTTLCLNTLFTSSPPVADQAGSKAKRVFTATTSSSTAKASPSTPPHPPVEDDSSGRDNTTRPDLPRFRRRPSSDERQPNPCSVRPAINRV